jgi:hypothetical protein
MSISVNSKITATSMMEVLSASRARWERAYVRRLVKPSAMPDISNKAVRFSNLPQFPGSGTVRTLESGDVAASIAGLPPTHYPENGPALVMYTMASIMTAEPQLALSRNDASLLQAVTASTLARCHTWSAIGRLPGDLATTEVAAVRYSARNQQLVVRPAKAGEDSATALWRHFLAVCPALLEGTQALNIALAGLGPSLFIYGAAIHANVGETYSLHLLERAILESLRASLSADHQAKLGVINGAGLMIMSAAAVSGYRASFIRAVAEDALFVTEAQIRLFPADAAALTARKARMTSEHGGACFMDRKTVGVVRAAEAAADEDIVSVADTEMSADFAGPAGTEALNRYFESFDAAATPRASSPINNDDAEAIRRFSAHAQQTQGLASSMIAAEESIGDVEF